ncbi:MAG: metallopeptidase TldD-related protein [Acidithiobacillus sp.]
MNERIESFLQALPDALSQLAHHDERLYVEFYAEETQYARLTQAKVNQSGGIHQESLTLTLAVGQSLLSLTMEGDLPDSDALKALVETLRKDLPHVPEDPWCHLDTGPQRVTTGSTYEFEGFAALANAYCDAAHHQDLVGILLSGPQIYAVCSSVGHCLIHRGGSTIADLSVFDKDHNAVKRVRKDPQTQDAVADIQAMAQSLKTMARPAITLQPGTYRAWLSPEAIAELLGTVSWYGFSVEAIRSGGSPLWMLYQQAQALSPQIYLSENRQSAAAPMFTAEGFLLPSEVPLICDGKAQESLRGPRSAREFGTSVNSSSGYPVSLSMREGTLHDIEVLRSIDTGLYIGRVWYSNISDPKSCRVTAMTRYDCFWVENGELQGPLSPARMDSSLYRLLGEDLEALGARVAILPETHSYGQRGWGSTQVPGVLTSVTITL